MRISDGSSDVCSVDLPPPKMVLDASSSKRPVPVPASPSVRKPSKVNSLSFVSRIFSQPSKRATPPVVTLSKTSASVPAPPVIRGNPPRFALVRLASREIGRVSGRDRLCQYGSISVGDGKVKKKNNK